MNLEAERLNRGLSQAAAATQIGIPRTVLRYAERGGRPHPATAKKIADFYGVLVTDLWPATTEAEAA